MTLMRSFLASTCQGLSQPTVGRHWKDVVSLTSWRSCPTVERSSENRESSTKWSVIYRTMGRRKLPTTLWKRMLSSNKHSMLTVQIVCLSTALLAYRAVELSVQRIWLVRQDSRWIRLSLRVKQLENKLSMALTQIQTFRLNLSNMSSKLIKDSRRINKQL